MPKEYFKLENTTKLSDLTGKKIHFIGISGVAMGQLAAAMSSAGYQVSGSDKAFYEPMGSFLKSKNLNLQEGYSPNNITEDCDLVVIGNAVSYGHPEVARVEDLGLNYSCFPKLLAEFLIKDKKSIVVTGTHGKTTTSGLIAQALLKLTDQPSYFIGGVVGNLERSLLHQAGEFATLEGDEYDSAFFAKVPKFTFYRPDICIINAIEFDHADIYENLESIRKEFDQLVESLKPESSLIICTDFPAIKEALPLWQKRKDLNILSFGSDTDADYSLSYQPGSPVTIKTPNGEQITINSQLIGSYNARNLTAAYLALLSGGLDSNKIAEALSETIAPKRRQEIFLKTKNNILMEDFAHHPTAIKETLESIKKTFPDYRLVVALEPASNTLKTNILEKELIDSLKESLEDTDRFYLYESFDVNSADALSTTTLLKELNQTQTIAKSEPNINQLYQLISKDLEFGNNLLVLLSNRSFGGLKEMLLENNL